MTILKQLSLFCIRGVMFLFISLITSVSVLAAPPLTPHTPHSLIIEPQSLNLEASYKLAGTYWLPDYLKSNLGTSSSDDNGGGDTNKKDQCSTYGFQTPSSVNLTFYSCDTVKPRPNLSCYKNCKCLPKYQYTNTNCKASEGKKVAGLSCEGKSESCICLPSVTVGTGEVCTLSCGGNCVKKQCKPTVTAGTGEVCSETCATGGACTAKRCKATVSVGSGEICTENCANGGTCTAKKCKSSVSVGAGETCSETCASSGACTAKRCKSNQSVSTGSYCSERCASDNNICTSTSCNSTSGYQYCSCGGYGGSVNSCGTTYYKSCSSCCSPSCSSDWGCSCGTYTVSDGCGGSCTKCSACCTPKKDETGCQWGTYSCSNGCSGTRQCCNSDPNKGNRWLEFYSNPGCGNGGSVGGKYWLITVDADEYCDCGKGKHQKSLRRSTGWSVSSTQYTDYTACSGGISSGNYWIMNDMYMGSCRCD